MVTSGCFCFANKTLLVVPAVGMVPCWILDRPYGMFDLVRPYDILVLAGRPSEEYFLSLHYFFEVCLGSCLKDFFY